MTKSKTAKYFPLLLLFIFVGHYDSASAQELTPLAKELFADKNNLTEFELTQKGITTHLTVPDLYIDRDKTEHVSPLSYLYLKMLWPSLGATPIHTRTNSQTEYAEAQIIRNSGQYFGIQLFQGALERPDDGIQKHITEDWISFSGEPPVPGFTRYVSKIMEYDVVKRQEIGFQILLPTDKDYSQKVFFECPVNYRVIQKSMYCTGNTYLGHLVYAEYTFSMTDLADWKKVDAAVHQLFEAMLSPQQNDQPPTDRSTK